MLEFYNVFIVYINSNSILGDKKIIKKAVFLDRDGTLIKDNKYRQK
jgi:histidinol phosphatase-like enzyme